MDSQIVVSDTISERSRSLVLDVRPDEFLEELKSRRECVSWTSYNINDTLTLCGEGFLQSVDITPIEESRIGKKEEGYDLEDFLVSEDDEDTEEAGELYTSVVVAPYVLMPRTAVDTGRNYIDEKQKVLQFVVEAAEDMGEQRKLPEF